MHHNCQAWQLQKLFQMLVGYYCLKSKICTASVQIIFSMVYKIALHFLFSFLIFEKTFRFLNVSVIAYAPWETFYHFFCGTLPCWKNLFLFILPPWKSDNHWKKIVTLIKNNLCYFVINHLNFFRLWARFDNEHLHSNTCWTFWLKKRFSFGCVIYDNGYWRYRCSSNCLWTTLTCFS